MLNYAKHLKVHAPENHFLLTKWYKTDGEWNNFVFSFHCWQSCALWWKVNELNPEIERDTVEEGSEVRVHDLRIV